MIVAGEAVLKASHIAPYTDFFAHGMGLISHEAPFLMTDHPVAYEGAVVALLALRLTDEFGIMPKPMLVADAAAGWARIAGAYVIPAPASYDTAVISTPSRGGRGWLI